MKAVGSNGLKKLITLIKTVFASKQDTISDLSTIRSGAALGATAVQNTNDCVHLTGNESISGTKTFTASYVHEKNLYADYTTTPSSSYLWGFNGYDKNTQEYGNFRFANRTDGTNRAEINVRAKNGNFGYLDLIADSNNNFYATCPSPKEDTTSSIQIDTVGARNTKLANYQEKLVSGTNIKTINNTSLLGSGNISISSPSSYIVESSINGTIWYRLWSDKWIEQGISTDTLGDGGSYTWTFPKPFKDTNYTIVLGAFNAGTYSTYKVSGDKSTTSVKLYQFGIKSSASANMCAYVCGYIS